MGKVRLIDIVMEQGCLPRLTDQEMKVLRIKFEDSQKVTRERIMEIEKKALERLLNKGL